MIDARMFFRDWVDSPSYKSKLGLKLCLIDPSNNEDYYDEYTISGLNSRLKFRVFNNSVHMQIDLSGIVEPNDGLFEFDVYCG